MRETFRIRVRAALLALGCCVLGSILTASAVPVTQPATSPAPRDPQSLRDHLFKQYGEGYEYAVDDDLKLVFACSTDRKTLDDLRQRLAEHAKALHRDLFANGLQEYLTVVIPKTWRGSAGGFYNPEERSLTAKAPGVVVMHEFTHALHFADQQARQQEHANWIIEGLAAVFESSRLVDGHLVPIPNHRLKIIQNLAKGNHQVPFEEYVKFSQKEFMKRPGNHYAQARYMLIYLLDKGLLKQWYDAYTAGWKEDATGAAALEKVCGKKLPQIEKDWVQWLLALPPLPERPATGPTTRSGEVGV